MQPLTKKEIKSLQAPNRLKKRYQKRALRLADTIENGVEVFDMHDPRFCVAGWAAKTLFWFPRDRGSVWTLISRLGMTPQQGHKVYTYYWGTGRKKNVSGLRRYAMTGQI